MKISQAKLDKLVWDLRARLRVDPIWHIRIIVHGDPKDANVETNADIQVNANIHYAYMTLNASSIETEEELRETIAHELLHVQLNPLTKMAHALAADTGDEALAKHVLDLEEEVIDRLARAFR